MKTELQNIEDIKLMVDQFYEKAKRDAEIGHFFNEVIQLNLEEHLPVIYSFWDSVLFGKGTYRGNPMLKHIDLHRKSSLNREHFNRWLFLWEETIDALYEGKKAEEAKLKAQTMKELMLYKIQQSEDPNFIQ